MSLKLARPLVCTKSFTWNETVWNPSMIQTALWLDAADASTVTTVSGAVSQWNDKSGNGRHVTQAIAGNRPAYSSAAINNKNALSFITDDSLQLSSPGFATGASSKSLFVVYQPGTTGSTSHWICGYAIGTATSSWFGMMYRNDTVKGDPYFATYATDLTDSATPTLSTKFAASTYDGTTLRLYRNGSEIASGARSLSTATNADFLIGKDTGTSSYMNGLIAEILFVSSAVSTDTRQRIEGYLAHKWGLTANLPAGHPYKTVGPTP